MFIPCIHCNEKQSDIFSYKVGCCVNAMLESMQELAEVDDLPFRYVYMTHCEAIGSFLLIKPRSKNRREAV